MRSNIVALVVVLVAGGIFAAQPQEVFDGNRKDVLSGDCYKACGFCFGVGNGVARTNTSASDDFAKEKASQNAKSNLIGRKAVESFVWPKTIDEDSVAVLARMASKLVSVQAEVNGIVNVYMEKTGPATYTAVVAVPESKLQEVTCVTLEEIKRGLLNPHWLKANFKSAPKALYAFYLSQKKLPPSLVGTEYASWGETQLDLFCGIPHPGVSTGSVSAGVGQGENESGGNLPVKETGIIGNINETIDF